MKIWLIICFALCVPIGLLEGAEKTTVTPFSMHSSTANAVSGNPVFTADGQNLLFQTGNPQQLKSFNLITRSTSAVPLPGLNRHNFIAAWPYSLSSITIETDGRDLIAGISNGLPELYRLTPDGTSLIFTNSEWKLTDYIASKDYSHIGVLHSWGSELPFSIYSVISNTVSVKNIDTPFSYYEFLHPTIDNTGENYAFMSWDNPSGASVSFGAQVYLQRKDAPYLVAGYHNAYGIDRSVTQTDWPKISGDGNMLYFVGHSNGGTTNLMRLDMNSQPFACTIVATNWHMKAEYDISDAGDVLTWENGKRIYVLRSNLVETISSELFHADEDSRRPIVSRDGRYITFLSKAQDGIWQVFQYEVESQSTVIVSRTASDNPLRRNVTQYAASLDGTSIAFVTDDSTVVEEDHNGTFDVFVRSSGETFLASQAARENILEARRSFITERSTTTDGRFIPLSAESNHVTSVYLWDNYLRQTKALAPQANANSSNIVISANGKRAAFISHATNLGHQTNAGPKVVVHEIEHGTNLVLNAGGINSSMPLSLPSFSTNGNRLVYQGQGLSETDSRLFVHDFITGTNFNAALANSSFPPSFPSGEIFKPLISPNGRYVLFQSRANLTSEAAGNNYKYYLRNLETQTNYGIPLENLNGSVFIPASFSFNRSSTVAAGISARKEVWIYDITNKTNFLNITADDYALSRASSKVALVLPLSLGNRSVQLLDYRTGASNTIYTGASTIYSGAPYYPVISDDGQYVVFACQATNVISGDTNIYGDLFVYDAAAGQTFCLTLNTNGQPSNGKSTHPILMENGQTVLFRSFATDLTTDRIDSLGGLYTVRLGAGDTDSDGLTDDWEVAWFGDLSEDGVGDFDNDGATNIEEFNGYTKPNDAESVFRPLILNSPGSDRIQLRWVVAAGKHYRVEYKDDLSQPWSELPSENINHSSGIASDTPTTSGARFYRVVML